MHMYIHYVHILSNIYVLAGLPVKWCLGYFSTCLLLFIALLLSGNIFSSWKIPIVICSILVCASKGIYTCTKVSGGIVLLSYI